MPGNIANELGLRGAVGGPCGPVSKSVMYAASCKVAPSELEPVAVPGALPWLER